MRVVPEPGQHHGVRHQLSELRGRDHRVVLAAGQQHRRGGGGDEPGHTGLTHREGPRVERRAPARSALPHARVQRGVGRVNETVEPGDPQVAGHRFGAGGEDRGGPLGHRGRPGQLVRGPGDLDAHSDDGAHPRPLRQVQPDHPAEAVPDHDGARRVEQRRHGVGHGGEGVLGRRGGAAVAGEVGRRPRPVAEGRAHPAPHVGGGPQPVQQQHQRRPSTAAQHPQRRHPGRIARCG
jgi:hypothetical protein